MLPWLACLPLFCQSSPSADLVLVGLDAVERAVDPATLDLADPRTQQAWRVRFGAPRPPAPAALAQAARLALWGGEQLRGTIRGGKGESLVFETLGGVALVIALEELDALHFPAHVPDLWSRPLEPAADGDRLYRRTQEALDVLEGGLEAFKPEGIEFHDLRVGRKTIPWREVAAYFVDRAMGSERKQHAGAGVPVVVDLADGGRLRGGLLRLSAQGLELERSGGERLKLPLSTLAMLCVDDGRLAFLSDLAPSSSLDALPFGDDLGMRWPLRIDANACGGELAAGGRRYARGVGVHAPSRVSWKLAAGWKELRGAVAIDDSSATLAARGSVVFRVLLDGREAWQSGVVRGGEPVRALPAIALAGAQELVLEVLDAGDGFAADRADWLELTLVR